jgi:aspartyl-tRNA(Asn)/glutamyl-tRNA(Gln) amidotransferase subunit A
LAVVADGQRPITSLQWLRRTMTDTEFAYIPATDLAALICTRQISPVELIRSKLSLIERSQGMLNAFITIPAEQALRNL